MNIAYIILILSGLVIAVLLAKIYFNSKQKPAEQKFANTGLAEYQQELQDKKEKAKEEIINIIKEKGKISNKDITEALKISEATATRYLDELEKDGKIKQVGETGKYTYYTL